MMTPAAPSDAAVQRVLLVEDHSLLSNGIKTCYRHCQAIMWSVKSMMVWESIPPVSG